MTVIRFLITTLVSSAFVQASSNLPADSLAAYSDATTHPHVKEEIDWVVVYTNDCCQHSNHSAHHHHHHDTTASFVSGGSRNHHHEDSHETSRHTTKHTPIEEHANPAHTGLGSSSTDISDVPVKQTSRPLRRPKHTVAPIRHQETPRPSEEPKNTEAPIQHKETPKPSEQPKNTVAPIQNPPQLVNQPTPNTPVTVSNPSEKIAPDEQFKIDMLETHNKLRAKHGVGPLVWDDSLASYAEEHTKACSSDHTQGPWGENLAWGYPSSIQAAEDWYNEISQYNPLNPGFSMATGHYSQVVWKDTKALGCYSRDCTEKLDGTLLMCEYNPPGNVVGDAGQFFTDNVLPLLHI